ncbi:unnamed protein product [Rotaria sp. Silwood1]|nr:unnamed protein product [Rotaria sp. Silwood1]CAF1615845.1 unnamed protein product [Rotaria sp. Silwood1]CAF3692910.1 unnamed protein product [Rotaria sp. Silwood1]CAF4651061.1 unnamed protein product [Rotaria sp. Silwood1]CAF4779645.1 unnamed protein product [Rotaria sp. Silwood1]
MRAIQVRLGDHRHKTKRFLLDSQCVRQKTKQIQNLSRLYETDTISLKQYLTSLSYLVGDSTSVEHMEKNNIKWTPTVTNNAVDNGNVD